MFVFFFYTIDLPITDFKNAFKEFSDKINIRIDISDSRVFYEILVTDYNQQIAKLEKIIKLQEASEKRFII